MKHAGIPFEEEFVRLRTPQTAERLAAISPSGQIPVLNHNGRIVWETLAILEYLDDLFPEKAFWPSDLGARAFARSVATEMHSGFRQVRIGWPHGRASNWVNSPAIRSWRFPGKRFRRRMLS